MRRTGSPKRCFKGHRLSSAPSPLNRRFSKLILAIVAGIVIGYLIGRPKEVPTELFVKSATEWFDVPIASHEAPVELDADMPAVTYGEMRRTKVTQPRSWQFVTSDVVAANRNDLRNTGLREVVPAATYDEMRRRETGPTSRWSPELPTIGTYEYQTCITCHDPHRAVVAPSESNKQESLAIRASRRAFNGAPPVIPHDVGRMNDVACHACHDQGVQIGQQAANRMSHGRLANCLQCHATPPPEPFAGMQQEIDNNFSGLAAPTGGSRAFADAPPVIPHSTWMRERCLSCHGGIAGWPGLEVTHRWRTNCAQCHATSAELEQTSFADGQANGKLQIGMPRL